MLDGGRIVTGRGHAAQVGRCLAVSEYLPWMHWKGNWIKRGHSYCRYADDCKYLRRQSSGGGPDARLGTGLD